MDKTQWHKELLDEIILLNKRDGLSIKTICERKGLSVDSAYEMLSRYRRGKLTFTVQNRRDETKRLISEFENGKSVNQIANEEGVPSYYINERFRKNGLDAEVRREMRNGLA